MTKGERSNSVAEGVGKTPTSLFGAQTVPVSTGVGVVAEEGLSQRAFKATREELFSCMSLLGREDDKVFHVLLPPEFEGGVEPPMYYPVKGETYVNRRTKAKYKSDKYKSELFEVPFVRMRGWYQEKFKTIPPSYQTLIEKVQDVAPEAVVYPKLEIDAANGTVKLNGRQVLLSKTNFAALYLIAKGCPMKDLHAKLVELHNGHSDKRIDWLDTFREGSRFANIDDIDDLRKTLSELRKKLQSVGFANAETLVPQRGNPVTFPMGRIVFNGT